MTGLSVGGTVYTSIDLNRLSSDLLQEGTRSVQKKDGGWRSAQPSPLLDVPDNRLTY